MPKPQEILEYILPFVATAGRYSACVQEHVGTHGAKDGATAFHHALSDADLTIQAYLEVVLLSRFPNVSYFSEEQEQSLNAKYFPIGAPLEVLLDPVDGTRSYIDKREHYQIIVTIHDQREIVGALCHMPRRDRCYIGIKGEGAYMLSMSDIATRAPWSKFTITPQGGPVLVFNSPELQEKIAPHYEVRDLLTAYEGAERLFNYADIFEGTCAANLYTPCQGIDGGAMAFIAAEAGAVVSDFAGNPLGSYRDSEKRILPNALLSVTREMHDKLLAILKS